MITTVIALSGGLHPERNLVGLLGHSLVRKAFLLHDRETPSVPPGCRTLVCDSPFSGETWNTLLEKITTQYILFSPWTAELRLDPRAPDRLIAAAEATGAGLVYADYADVVGGMLRERPLVDYQMGSLRDGFSFGPLVLLSTAAVRWAIRKYGKIPAYHWAGWYDLRLKLSADYPLFHLPERLCMVEANPVTDAGGGSALFAYVDPRNRLHQEEMEAAATAHLKRIGAYLPSECKAVPSFPDAFALEASVVIPVRNRIRTVADAVHSALAQQTDFAFNVLVVDNHSTDGTTELLADLAGRHPALHHLIPERQDLSIGGCWNEALFSTQCGRYAVQLDSDDLYGGNDALRRLVELLRREKCAMAVGSYTLVNECLEEIPPGLIDHKEWTDANGRNNALRINGLGAPRAFDTALLRRIGFPNVGYGEDYAVALRLCREYRIGRIFESLYLCRRWEGNTDAALSWEQANRYDLYKDRLRTMEIAARRKMNGVRGWRS